MPAKLLKSAPYLLLLLFFVGTSMWSQISLFVSGVGQDQAPAIKITNQELTAMVFNKTGVAMPDFYISKSPKVWGMMAGVPGRPTMLLSQPLYETFNQDELQFVILHEIGHYAYNHSLKELLVSLLLLGIGSVVLRKITSLKRVLITSVCLGFLFGIVALQYGKWNEYEADRYAISNMDDPQGAIQAAYRFKDAYSQPDKEGLHHILLFRRVPYYERIKTANEELGRRKGQQQ